MKMQLTIKAYVEGLPYDVQPLVKHITDDVDAEGTMIAKYIDPMLDAAADRWRGIAYAEFRDNMLVVRPEKIIALHYHVVAGD